MILGQKLKVISTKALGIILFLILSLILTETNNSYASDYLRNSIKISAYGMEAQSQRLQVIAQNIANKDSTGFLPGEESYRRQISIFESKKDKSLSNNVKRIKLKKITTDKSDLRKIYDPNHPAADEKGFVLYPNVDNNIEQADSRESMRTYDANLNIVDVSRSMYLKTIDMIK